MRIEAFSVLFLADNFLPKVSPKTIFLILLFDAENTFKFQKLFLLLTSEINEQDSKKRSMHEPLAFIKDDF